MSSYNNDGIPIIDITSETASKSWPLLITQLEKADYVALDLELSGLGKTSAKSVDLHYEQLCEVVKMRSVLSLGVTTFKLLHTDHSERSKVSLPEEQGSEVMHESESSETESSKVTRHEVTDVEVQVFNVWLLCGRAYMIDPSSAKFLVSHGFDFNKQFSQGLPYTPPEARNKKYVLPEFSMDEILAKIVFHKIPLILHNGLLDLVHLYHSCVGPLPHALPTLLADLADLLVGGVYDTKAIAQFKFYEESTFLEYLFRKSQRWSGAWSHKEEECHLKLHPPVNITCTDGLCVEVEHVAPPTKLPREQLLQVEVCNAYTDFGYCHAYNCTRSHDVTVAIDKKFLLSHPGRKKRKRTREDVKKEDMNGSHDHVMPEDSSDLAHLFQTEISAAKGRLEDHATVDPDSTTQSETTPTQHSEFRSHRSGVDSFMTGFAFTCYTLQALGSGCHGNPDNESGILSGLSEVRNCLASRRRGQHHLPITIFKSKYAKNSGAFSSNHERLLAMATIPNKLYSHISCCN